MGFNDIDIKVSGGSDIISTLQTYTTKILKPNIVDGKNVLTQEMLSSKNTKYVIKYNYELLGATLTMPQNVILEFDGGSLANGAIVYKNTKCVNSNYHNVIITGVCKNDIVTPYDYGYNDDNTDDVNGVALNNAFTYADTVYLKGKTFKYSGFLAVQDCAVLGDKGTLKLTTQQAVNNDAVSFVGDVSLIDVNIDLDHKDCWGISSEEDSNLTICGGSIRNVGIEDITIANNKRAALLIRGNASINGLLIEDCTAYGICIFGKVPTLTQDHKLDYNASLAYGLNVEIVNCIVRNVGSHGITNTQYHIFKSLTIDNCYTEYCGNKKANSGWVTGGSGIGAHNCANFIISNCHSNNNYEHGLVLQDCLNGTIVSNISQYNRSCGIRLQANYTKENDEWVPETDDRFYGLSGCANVNVLNNYISHNSIYGIYIGQRIRNTCINCNSVFGNVLQPIYVQGHAGNNPPVDKYSDPENISIIDNFISSDANPVGFRNVVINDAFIKDIKVRNVINGKMVNAVIGSTSTIKYLIDAKKSVPLDFYKTNFVFNAASAVNQIVYSSRVKLDHADFTPDDNIVVSLRFKSFPTANVYRCIISLRDENNTAITSISVSNDQVNYRATKFREDGVVSIVYPLSSVTDEQCQATRYFVLEIASNAAYSETPVVDFVYFGLGEYDQTDVKCKKNILTDIVNTNVEVGTQYFNSNKHITYNGSKYIEYDGATVDVKRYGTFADKPTSSNIYIGFKYFCTDKQTVEGATDGIEIIHKGNNVWVDALGRVVS